MVQFTVPSRDATHDIITATHHHGHGSSIFKITPSKYLCTHQHAVNLSAQYSFVRVFAPRCWQEDVQFNIIYG